MDTSFLDAARQGKNNWWRYLLSLLLIAFFWFILGTIPYAIWLLQNPSASTSTDPVQQIWQFALVSLSFCFFALGLFIAVQSLHRRRIRTLIRSDAHINLRRILQGAGVWVILLALPCSIEAIVFPSHYAVTFKPDIWFVLLPIALLLTPIQSATEELFFRGYAFQGLSLLIKNRWILIGVISAVFAVLHFGNPEVGASNSFVWIALNYFAFAVFFSLITLLDNSLELAIGAHAANNLFLGLIISPKVSALGTPAIFTQTLVADSRVEFFLFLAQITLFYFVFFGRSTRRANQ